MCDTLSDIALLQLRQIETRGEMLSLAGNQDGADTIGRRRKKLLDADDRLVVERVALLRAVQPQDGDRAVALGDERGWKPDCKTFRHHCTSYTSSRTARGSR